MTPSKNCLDLIKSQEGCILHPYLDQAGVPTIGWGSTRYNDGTHVTMYDKGTTQEMADNLLQTAADQVAEAVSTMVSGQINQNQFDALVDFAYNEGTGALHGSTLLRLINQNKADPNIRPAFLMWTKIHKDGVLITLSDLVKRRTAEADLYFTSM